MLTLLFLPFSSLETVTGLDSNSELFSISVSGVLYLQVGMGTLIRPRGVPYGQPHILQGASYWHKNAAQLGSQNVTTLPLGARQIRTVHAEAHAALSSLLFSV